MIIMNALQTEGGLANKFIGQYITDIPWIKDPLLAFSKNDEAYVEAFKNVIGDLPVPHTTISFNNDKWDFNPYIFNATQGNKYKFTFSDLPPEIKDKTKFYVIHEIMGKRKISTISLHVMIIRHIFNKIKSTTGHINVNTIDTDDIINVIESSNVSASTKHNYYESIFQLYSFLEKNYHLCFPVDLKIIKQHVLYEKKKSKELSNKIPNIPAEYLNKIVTAATTVMRDETAEHNIRATACIILILSQTGIRLGDVLTLTTDRLRTTTLKNSGLTVHYIHYIAKKPSKAHDKMLEFDIVSNSLCTEAFKTLLNLREKVPNHDLNNFLYILVPYDGRKKSSIPVTTYAYHHHEKRFFFTYLHEECTREWENINPIQYMKKNICISIPETRQYRVAVCTYFYEHGIPLIYIQRFMGHLSEYMLGYYVRPKDNTVENMQFSEKVISSMMIDDDTPIGYMGDELKKRMKNFLESNSSVNVEKTPEDLVNTFGDRVIIRAKEGGICACIRTSFMPCAWDARSNEALCAYGDCKNIYLFYYNVDITWLDFVSACETYQHNIKIGRRLEAQKELVKVRDIAKRRLIPQLKELDHKLDTIGKEAILKKYPSLIDIIEKESDIKKEVKEWATK
jgi:integrase